MMTTVEQLRLACSIRVDGIILAHESAFRGALEGHQSFGTAPRSVPGMQAVERSQTSIRPGSEEGLLLHRRLITIVQPVLPSDSGLQWLQENHQPDTVVQPLLPSDSRLQQLLWHHRPITIVQPLLPSDSGLQQLLWHHRPIAIV